MAKTDRPTTKPRVDATGRVLLALVIILLLVTAGVSPARADAISNALELHKWKLMVTSGMLASVTAPETINRYYTQNVVPGVGADGLLSAGSETYALDMEKWNNRPASSYFGQEITYRTDAPGYSAAASAAEQKKAATARTVLANAYAAPAAVATKVKATAATMGTMTSTALAELKQKTRVPVAAAGTMLNAAGGAVMAVSSYGFGTQFGGGVVGMFGIDANEAVCSNVEGSARKFVNLLTGTDCAAWDFAQGFVPNEGIVAESPIGGICKGAPLPTTGSAGATAPNCRGAYLLYSSSGQSVKNEQGLVTADGFAVAANRVTATITLHPNPGRPAGTTAYNVTVSSFCITSAGVVGQSLGGASILGVTAPRDGSQVVQALSSSAVALNASTCVKRATFMTTEYATGRAGGWVWVEGAPQVEMEYAPANPDRTLQCTITGTDGQTYTANSPAYKQDGGDLPVPDCPTLPEGVFPANTTLTENGGGQSNVLYDEPSSEAFKDAATKYPDCLTFPCALDLLLKTTGQSCFDLDAQCDGWRTDTQREDKYQCSYGAYDVPLFECNVYGTTFNFDLRTGGQPYADPATGLPTNTPVAPTVVEQLMQSGVMPPEGARNCWPTGWGALNPLNYVYTPVRCVLEWAFVPREAAVKLELASLSASWAGTPPGLVFEAAEGWGAELPEADGCQGPPVPLKLEWPMHIDHTMYPLYACDGPGAFAAGLCRMLSSIAMIYGSFRAITWYLGRSVGYGGFGAA